MNEINVEEMLLHYQSKLRMVIDDLEKNIKILEQLQLSNEKNGLFELINKKFTQSLLETKGVKTELENELYHLQKIQNELMEE